jgi:hypothetical protein
MTHITYTEMVDKVQEWLEDDDAEFQGSIDDVISLGETRLLRDLDLSIFSTEDTTVTVDMQDFTLKPTSVNDVISWQSIYYDSGSERTWLELRSSAFVRDHQIPSTTGSPKYYAEHTQLRWLLSPVPDAVYTLTARGITRPEGLSGSIPNTWLGDNAGDILFKAVLAEAEGFLKADDRVEMWAAQYVGALPTAKRELYEMQGQHYNLTPMEVPAAPLNQANQR